jgi:hypothetical protein
MKLPRLIAPSLAAACIAGAFAAHAQTPPQPAASAPASCSLSSADREWLESALRHWRVVERGALKLAPVPYPKVVAADAHCTAVGIDKGGGNFAWQGTPHDGMVRLPDGKEAPIGPMSFAAPDPSSPGATYFVMSMPSVWRAKGVKSALGLETLMDAVLLHEMAHTRQYLAISPVMDRLTAQYKLPDDISDDSLQEAYGNNPDYVRSYETERDLLYAAAAAPTDAQARALAAQALANMRARRERWFNGAEEKWLGLDEVFLTMEGLGQWAAYWWFVSPEGLKLDPAVAQREMRRGGKHWTQEEGLALFLVVDRLVPNWQSRVFDANQPALAEALLAAAAAAGK